MHEERVMRLVILLRYFLIESLIELSFIRFLIKYLIIILSIKILSHHNSTLKKNHTNAY